MDCADLPAPCHRLDQFIDVLGTVLRSQQHSPLHEAATFSRLLCVNRRLREAVLSAGVGQITLELILADLDFVSCSGEAEAGHNFLQWLHQHLRLQTLRRVECLPDLFANPAWWRRRGAKFVCNSDNLRRETLALLSRITTILAAAHAFLGPRTPIVKLWVADYILPATLSEFASQHLTQLVLVGTYHDDRAWGELAALTSLKDLRLPFFDCGQGGCYASYRLEDALKHLTQLTALLLSNPTPAVQQCIPASVQELVLLLHCFAGQEKVALKSLSSLTALYLIRPGDIPALSEEDQSLHMPLSADLPDSLQLLASALTLTEENLLQASQLRVLQLLEFPHPMQHSCMALLQSKRLAHLTSLELLQHPEEYLPFERLNDEFVRQVSSTTLPVHVLELQLALPSTVMDQVLISSGFEALGSLTSLTLLHLETEWRPATTDVAVAEGNGEGADAWNGSVQQLAAALEHLTNLEELSLRDIDMANSSGVERAFGKDWLPVTQAIAGLPKLRGLRLSKLPLEGAATALAHARHLSTLTLARCSFTLDDIKTILAELTRREPLLTWSVW